MKTKNTLALGLLVAAALAAAGYGLYTAGMRRGLGAHEAAAGASAAGPGPAAPINESGEDATRRHIAAGLKAGDTDPLTGKRILYYHDPMVPGNKFDKPAKSPFMDMMLSPVYADGGGGNGGNGGNGGDGGDGGQVTVSSRVQQNLGVRTAVATEGTLAPQVSAVGSIAFNERDQVVVQARATGFVERLFVRATLDPVSKGQSLAELYVPDWVAAQEEFLSLRRMQGRELAPLVDAARARMRQAGMNETQIAAVERSGSVQARTTLIAPIGGVVTELSAREGMTVMAGATLLRINGLATVWAHAAVPESQVALLRRGTPVEARSPAVPGVTFKGRVQALLPEVDPATRTLKARMELANPGARLVPGMFVQMQFMDMRADKAVLVPTEAIIQTGRRTVVMLAEDDGRFRPADVEIGLETGGQTEVRRGLQAGQRVVVSSQFLIDSEASLRGVEARSNAQPAPGAAKDAARHEGEGTVESIDRDAVTLSHGPIASLKWGAMTMEFKPPRAGLPRALAAGDRVAFEFTMDAEGQAQLTRITPLAASPPAAPASAGSRP